MCIRTAHPNVTQYFLVSFGRSENSRISFRFIFSLCASDTDEAFFFLFFFTFFLLMPMSLKHRHRHSFILSVFFFDKDMRHEYIVDLEHVSQSHVCCTNAARASMKHCVAKIIRICAHDARQRIIFNSIC